jgi:succinate dehydrogenase flavin-adding protein (antitoxin of CptAB toxin-antitoxin module)
MRIVSKEWQEISEEKHKEMYEYLSLRDRELYDVLCKSWKSIKNEAVKLG